MAEPGHPDRPGPRNIFVLCTGRCGSTTFIEAAKHITNFSAAHESRTHFFGSSKLDYPSHHIEADNRLSWHLGRLDAAYGDRAWYVHLTRNREEVATSMAERRPQGIGRFYHRVILLGTKKISTATRYDACLDFVDTVTANISLFLRDKTHVLPVALETGKADFDRFWDWIGAKGNRAAALAEWDVKHNARKTTQAP